MKSVCLSVAAAELSDLRALQRTNPAKTGLGLVLGAISAVVAMVIIWAVFLRKRRDETARRYREHFIRSQEVQAESSGEGGSNGASSGRRKKRRREHRQRNPTLAETGGLPPVRNDLPTDDPP